MKKLAILIPLAVIVLGAALWISGRIVADIYRKMFNPYLDRQISGPVSLTSEWLEIRPSEPLVATRQIQYIDLIFPQPGVPDVKAGGLRMQDGTIVAPAIELVDDKNNAFPLKAVAFGQTGLSFASEQDLPRDRTYPLVRIKANQPFPVSAVYWRCFNRWDLS